MTWLKERFKVKEVVQVSGEIIRCNCLSTRGYWHGMPLIHERKPNLLSVKNLVIVEGKHIYYTICSHCECLYFKIKDVLDVKPTIVSEQFETIS